MSGALIRAEEALGSERKIKANRDNARASTGPKTAQSRVRTARNALRRGLSLSVYSDLGLSEEVETLQHVPIIVVHSLHA